MVAPDWRVSHRFFAKLPAYFHVKGVTNTQASDAFFTSICTAGVCIPLERPILLLFFYLLFSLIPPSITTQTVRQMLL